MGDAGVVDENVDATEVLDDFGDGLLDLRFVSNVGGEAEMTFAQGGGGIPCSGFIQVEDHDASALLREGRCRSAADATCGSCTGDDRDFAFEKHGRVPLIVFIGSIHEEPMTQLVLLADPEQ
ncbi:hypothetical protein D9M71_260710 [compost metagenome]